MNLFPVSIKCHSIVFLLLGVDCHVKYASINLCSAQIGFDLLDEWSERVDNEQTEHLIRHCSTAMSCIWLSLGAKSTRPTNIKMEKLTRWEQSSPRGSKWNIPYTVCNENGERHEKNCIRNWKIVVAFNKSNWFIHLWCWVLRRVNWHCFHSHALFVIIKCAFPSNFLCLLSFFLAHRSLTFSLSFRSVWLSHSFA